MMLQVVKDESKNKYLLKIKISWDKQNSLFWYVQTLIIKWKLSLKFCVQLEWYYFRLALGISKKGVSVIFNGGKLVKYETITNNALHVSPATY